MQKDVKSTRPLEVKYGTPSPLSSEERAFLSDLDKKIWNRSTDDLGYEHAFPSSVLTDDERVRILDLIGSHVLPCIMCSSVYGSLSIDVADHPFAPGITPERIISISEDHFNKFNIGPGFDKWGDRFDAISPLTHNDRNRQICEYYKLPLPGPKSSYGY
jgi:hypothetical protein